MPFGIIGLTSLQPSPEWTITQVPVALGASGTFSAAATGVCTLTFTSAHGLTMTPASGVPPNYYFIGGGSTSGLTGTGIIVGNCFRILSIPSTTTLTFYSTITAATVTSLTVIPVFFPSIALGPNLIGGQPTMLGVNEPFPVLAGAVMNIIGGANCVVSIAPQTVPSGTLFIPLDGTTTAQLAAVPGNVAGTPSTAPTLRTLLAASSSGQIDMGFPFLFIQASGSAGTTYVEILR